MKADPSRYLEFRRDIHRHPELSNQEVETTRRIREFLARDGLELCPIGALNGGFVRINAGKARTLCMRADIDALPLTEHTGAPFSSVHEGVMHACGHDMHTAIAAGIACELNRVKDRLNCFGGALAYGHPYGASGAEIMIHLMAILKQKNGRYGVAAIPAAGGVAEAILIENKMGRDA